MLNDAHKYIAIRLTALTTAVVISFLVEGVVRPALAERAPIYPPEAQLTPYPADPPKAGATPLVEKKEDFPCECEGKIVAICLPKEEFEKHCGKGAGACAKGKICTMYFPKDSEACDTMQDTIPMQPIPITDLAGSLDVVRVATPDTNENMLVGKPAAKDLAAAMISSLGFDADKLPTIEDVKNFCLYQHELDHLCRKTKNPTRCNREAPAMGIHTQCLLNKFDEFCSIIDEQNKSLCLNICHQYVHFGAIAQFSDCFCKKIEEDGQAPGSYYDPGSRDNCCECYEVCRRFEIPQQCERFRDEILLGLQTRQNACDGTLKAKNVHTCSWYAQWPDLQRNNPSVICPDPIAEQGLSR